MKMHTKPPTVDRLRKDIDRGRTGDKVDYPDPAAAPLGTDEEASGSPPTETQLAQETVPKSADRSFDPAPVIYILIATAFLVIFAAIVAFA